MDNHFQAMKVFLVCFAILVALFATANAMQQQIMIDGKLRPVQTDNPFFEYLDTPSKYFKWSEGPMAPIHNDTIDAYFVHFASQQWLDNTEVDRSVWEHDLAIIVPKKLKIIGSALVYITGLRQDSDPVKSKNGAEWNKAVEFAHQSGSVVAMLLNVPNQSLTFLKDPLRKQRIEDESVAYTWSQFMRYPDRPDWVLYCPMAKSAVRALDVLEQWSHVKSERGQFPFPLTRFMFTGESKRGATTWFASAYEASKPLSQRRIIGAAPVVFDTLNFTRTIPHIHRLLGGWTFALEDYLNEGLLQYVVTDQIKTLAAMVDPLEPQYMTSLQTIPLLVVSALGDEFFLPDNDHFYWDHIHGDKHRLLVPNAEHALITNLSVYTKGVSKFYRALALKIAIPHIEWVLDQENGSITVYTDYKPDEILLWRSETIPSTPNRRDFRLLRKNVPGNCDGGVPFKDMCVNPVLWSSTNVEGMYDETKKKWTCSYTEPLPTPENKWIGAFIGLRFNIGTEDEQLYTSQAVFVPNTIPFPPCGTDGANCEEPNLV